MGGSGDNNHGVKKGKDVAQSADRFKANNMGKNNTIEELKALPGGDKFVENNDGAGNSIVSRITRSLGSLKTLSGVGLDGEGNRNFNLFSHH